jgi:hypothetical protein
MIDLPRSSYQTSALSVTHHPTCVQRTLGAEIDDEFIAELKGAHAANQVGGIFIIEELHLRERARTVARAEKVHPQWRNAATRRERILDARDC